MADEANTYCEGNPGACTVNDIKPEGQWVSIIYIYFKNIISKQYHYKKYSKMKMWLRFPCYPIVKFFFTNKRNFFRFNDDNYDEASAAKEKAYLVVSKVKY